MPSWGRRRTCCRSRSGHGSNVIGLSAGAGASIGMVGARFALAATAGNNSSRRSWKWSTTNGLPCPMLEGRSASGTRCRYGGPTCSWSTPRREHRQADRVRQDRPLWRDHPAQGQLAGKPRTFPGELEEFSQPRASLKRAVAKMTAAGLGAGVHVLRPSISPNDPYVTPKPDDRLACVPCPPLAESGEREFVHTYSNRSRWRVATDRPAQ